MIKQAFEAVIFDFDGVIADTMKDNCMAWQKAFADRGFRLDPVEYYQLEGMGRYQIAEHFINAYKLDPGMKEEVVEAKELNYKNNNSFRIYAEIPAIFDLLKKHSVAIAIVTGASRNRMEAHFNGTLREQVSLIITADDVTHTKPHPEPYSKAVSKLGLAAENCLVIENAILGIKSAKAAGCHCFAIETTLNGAFLKQADQIFQDHKELLTTFENIYRKR